MPQEINVSTAFPDFDGLINIVFRDEEKQELFRFPNIDAAELYNDINQSLNENERKGLPYIQAVQRYVYVRFNVKINVHAATRLMDDLEGVLVKADAFFSPSLDSSASMEDSLPKPASSDTVGPDTLPSDATSTDSLPKSPSEPSTTSISNTPSVEPI